MTRFATCVLLLLWTPCLHAEDSFSVLIPDSKNQRLVQLFVEATTEGVSIREAGALELPFAPASTAFNATRNQVIVAPSAQDTPQAASINVTKTGDLGEVALVATAKLAHPAGYTSVDRSGRFFMTAHYRSGTLAVYRIKEDGSVGELTHSLQTPNREAHCILTTPDNRFAYVPCVKNNNALYQYAFDAKAGRLQPLEPFNAKPPAMFGPRHVVYHPTLNVAYFSNEQQLGVSVYAIASDGQLTDLQHATTMPRRSPFAKGKRDMHASDLVLSPDGNRLYVAVRDFQGDEDSVFTFGVDAEGKLSQIARSKVGDIPWKLSISRDGKLLLVSETGDRTLSAYRIQSQGTLIRAATFKVESGVRDMVIP